MVHDGMGPALVMYEAPPTASGHGGSGIGAVKSGTLRGELIPDGRGGRGAPVESNYVAPSTIQTTKAQPLAEYVAPASVKALRQPAADQLYAVPGDDLLDV